MNVGHSEHRGKRMFTDFLCPSHNTIRDNGDSSWLGGAILDICHWMRITFVNHESIDELIVSSEFEVNHASLCTYWIVQGVSKKLQTL